MVKAMEETLNNYNKETLGMNVPVIVGSAFIWEKFKEKKRRYLLATLSSIYIRHFKATSFIADSTDQHLNAELIGYQLYNPLSVREIRGTTESYN